MNSEYRSHLYIYTSAADASHAMRSGVCNRIHTRHEHVRPVHVHEIRLLHSPLSPCPLLSILAACLSHFASLSSRLSRRCPSLCSARKCDHRIHIHIRAHKQATFCSICRSYFYRAHVLDACWRRTTDAVGARGRLESARQHHMCVDTHTDWLINRC